MPELVTVVLFALLPPAGNFVGGLVAEVLPESKRFRSAALHAAAGVVVAVVAVEIMPTALDVLSGWAIGLAFAVGGILYLFADWGMDRLSGGNSRMWMIYLAVSFDLFADGLLIGAGSSIGASLGLALAVGQVLADMPEGAAAIMTFRASEVPRSRRFLLSAGLFIPPLVATLVAYLLLREAGQGTQSAALVVTAGLFSVAALEDMLKEAHEAESDSKVLTLSLVLGFSLFAIVSQILG